MSLSLRLEKTLTSRLLVSSVRQDSCHRKAELSLVLLVKRAEHIAQIFDAE